MDKDINLISRQIEAVLFYKGDSTHINELTKELGADREQIIHGIELLKERLIKSGLVLIEHNDEFSLATGIESSSIIERMIKEDLHRDIGKAGLETLATIMYLGPISRAELDNIRGVNSTFILRNLLIRGLINRIVNPHNKRTYLYEATSDLLKHLGIQKIEDLPEYDELREELINKEKLRTLTEEKDA